MTIASALTALNTDIQNARTAITNKGGTVTSGGGSSQLATDIATIPSGTTPTGTLSITANGVYDVANYASADVSVSSSGILLAVTNLATGAPRTFYLTLGNNNTWNRDLIISNSIEGRGHLSYIYYYITFVWNIEPNTDYTLFSDDGSGMNFARERLINISENTFLSFNKAASGGSN